MSFPVREIFFCDRTASAVFVFGGNMSERLQKYLARSGVASRRKCDEYIAAGLVRVNGRTVSVPGMKIIPGKDVVEFGGREVVPEKKRYFVFNKPAGVITSARDTHGRKTVLDYFSGLDVRVFPIGRLDYDTEGLLLFTNDGEFANTLIHPSFKVWKKYVAETDRYIEDSKIVRMREGMILEDGPTLPARVRIMDRNKGFSKIEISIREGRKRQVRRMFAAVGAKKIKLKRTEIGGLTLNGLASGDFRELKTEEVDMLRKLAENDTGI